MKAIHVPRINARYWYAITLASVFGTNLGDSYSHDSGLGIGDWLAENRLLDIGLPPSTLLTGAAFVAVLLFMRSGERPTAATAA